MLQNTGMKSPSILGLTDGFAARTQDSLLLAGRILIGWIFINSGWRKLLDIPAFVESMPGRDLPRFLGYVAPPVEFIGGVCIVLGLATRYAALVMLLFMIIATFSSHRYWNFTDPNAYRIQNSNFWKNVAMTGGIVLLFATGAGRYALDRLLQRKVD
jgi:putative oxidoreductase